MTSVTLSQPSGQAAITKWAVKVLELNGVTHLAALDTSGSAANSAVTILKTGLSGSVAASGEFVVGAVATSGATSALTLAQGSSTPTSGWVALTDFGTGTTTTDVMGRAAYFTSTTAGSQYQAAWSTSASKSGGGALVVFKAGP